jgi:hypothetical protein
VSRKGVKKGAVLALLAVVALVGGAALMHWYDDTASHEPPVRSIAAQGDVTPNNAIQPAPAPSMQASQAVAPAPTTSASTSTSSSSGTESGDKRHRLMSLALARAHTGLEQNDLRMARSGIYWTLSLQPDNSDALGMKQDLLSRERARDAALKAARSCVGQERQQCVWQNANTALSIDSSSAGAKALVESSRGAKPPGVPSVPTNGTMGTMPQ